MKYAFIKSQSQNYSVARMCAVLEVSRSGYYEWRDRPPSRRAKDDLRLIRQIRMLHVESREAYGAYRTWRVLRDRGVSCGRHRVARLRTAHGIEAKALLPAPDHALRLARPPHDLRGAVAGSGQKDDPRAPDMLLRTIAISQNRFKAGAVAGPQSFDGVLRLVHPQDSHDRVHRGIHKGITFLDLFH